MGKPSKQQQEEAAGHHARHEDVALSEQQTSHHLILELLVFQFGIQKLVSGSRFKLAQDVLDREEKSQCVSPALNQFSPAGDTETSNGTAPSRRIRSRSSHHSGSGLPASLGPCRLHGGGKEFEQCLCFVRLLNPGNGAPFNRLRTKGR